MNRVKLDVIIPTYQENDDTHLIKMAATYPIHSHIQYTIVDSGSDKAFLHRVKRHDFNILFDGPSTRGEKLNFGFQQTKGEIILFHHPRSLIEPQGLLYLVENGKNMGWGGFTHQFDHPSMGLRFTSWYSNTIRPRLWKVLYLDHCIFCRRERLTKPIPSVPIFEDTELSYLLNRASPPEILPFVSTTSAIRFQKNGFFKQSLMNQKLKLEFFLGRSKRKMNAQYEKNLNLNG